MSCFTPPRRFCSFLVLRQMTGALWRSAFVAAVFAIHPLRVESVAWVAERKDVLSGLFFMLTIGGIRPLYAHAVVRLLRYGLVSFCLALGLMCKPMLVTLPFVLLLLDYWPLNRFARLTSEESSSIPPTANSRKAALARPGPRLLSGHAFRPKDACSQSRRFPCPARLGNAVISYTDYLRQMLWPSDLAVLISMGAARHRCINGICARHCSVARHFQPSFSFCAAAVTL